MKTFFLFLLLFFFFFAAGIFLDSAFHFWGTLTNVILLWFFIVASYRLQWHEILYAGWLMGFAYGFFAAGPAWFWFLVFFMTSFVMLIAHNLAGVSGRFRFFFFSLMGWLGALLVRILTFFFTASARVPYGMAWHYVISSALGWETILSAALLCCIAAAAHRAERKERVYYV